LSPTTLTTAVGDFTQFVGLDGLALDTESLSQILEVFGVETEYAIIQQAVCTLTNLNDIQANITARLSLSSGSDEPISIASYTCSLPIPAKPGLRETIPIN
jgi:hypothetical protein